MKKTTKEFSERYSAAKRWRDGVRPLIEDVMRFCSPGREKDFTTNHLNNKTEDETTVFTSLGEEMATDLASDLVTYFVPPENKWAEYLVTAPIPEEDADAVKKIVEDRESTLFDVLSETNFNDMAPAMMFEAATHGTPAIWVNTSHIMQPINFQVVPPHELLLVPGHLGYLDRFRETMTPASGLKALFSGWDVDLSDPKLVELMKKPLTNVKVCWGFWLDWEDAGNPMWRCEITINGKRITPDTPLSLGPMAGSCPLIVGRFLPRPGKVWGRGAAMKALPDLRVLDTVSDLTLSGLDQSLTNTLIYADDGFLDLSEGLQAGRAYPAHRGFTRDQIYDLSRNVNVDQGWFTEERMEARIRMAFYQDGPRQRGETPPTAAQWLDERRRVQQRIGKPSAPLWSELIVPMIQRVEYLAVQLGKMEDAISHNGNIITVSPISPLQKAQNQDQVMIAQANMQFAAGILGPENMSAVINPVATMKNMIAKSGDQITVVAEEEAVATPPPAQ
jgi:hypothetical protein